MAFFGFKDLSSLSNIDMTIYRYVTQNSDKVVYMRVRDIAQNAHVSSSSVMRFIHKIGFNSFPEFKAYLKNDALQHKPKNTKFTYINENNFPKDIETRLMIVANAVFQSDNITTVGMGDSAFLAEYAARRIASLGFNTTAVTDPFYPLHAKLENTTNNICELKAILYALVKYGLYNPTPTVYSDSAYAINSLTVWRHTWKDKGWNRYDGGTIKNLELIQAFDELEEKGFKINLIKVKGHDNVEGNILADKLATGKILPEDILNKK